MSKRIFLMVPEKEEDDCPGCCLELAPENCAKTAFVSCEGKILKELDEIIYHFGEMFMKYKSSVCSACHFCGYGCNFPQELEKVTCISRGWVYRKVREVKK